MSGLKKTQRGQKCHAETISMEDRNKKSTAMNYFPQVFHKQGTDSLWRMCKVGPIKQISIVIGAVVKYAYTSIVAPRCTQLINK